MAAFDRWPVLSFEASYCPHFSVCEIETCVFTFGNNSWASQLLLQLLRRWASWKTLYITRSVVEFWMQKPTGVRSLFNSLGILSHFLMSSYKIRQQFTFLKYQQNPPPPNWKCFEYSNEGEIFQVCLREQKDLSPIWQEDTVLLQCLGSSAWDIITGTCQSVTGWERAAAEDLCCEWWPWT